MSMVEYVLLVTILSTACTQVPTQTHVLYKTTSSTSTVYGKCTYHDVTWMCKIVLLCMKSTVVSFTSIKHLK